MSREGFQPGSVSGIRGGGRASASRARRPWQVRSPAGTLNAMPVSRGFLRRRQPVEDPWRVPPGRYVTRDFPVLSAGPTPHTALDEWTFTITGRVDEPVS